MNTESLVSADTLALRPTRARGWRTGLANFFSKEFMQHWGHNAAVKIAIVTGILNGFTAFVVLMANGGPDIGEPVASVAVSMFLSLAAIALTVSSIIAMQRGILGERQLGTAEWVLSKPLSRPAFILAKFFGYVVGLILIGVVLQAAIFYAWVTLWVGATLQIVPFLSALGIITLHAVFYLTLTLALGTRLGSRGAVTGAALGFYFVGSVSSQLAPKALLYTPWGLMNIATVVAQGPAALGGSPAPLNMAEPVIFTAVEALLFLVLAVYRFSRQDI